MRIQHLVEASWLSKASTCMLPGAHSEMVRCDILRFQPRTDSQMEPEQYCWYLGVAHHQIVTVSGNPLFIISKYFDLTRGKPILLKPPAISLSKRELKGLYLNASSKFHVPLIKPVKLVNIKFALLNMKIAKNEIGTKEGDDINRFYLTGKNLNTSPLIDFPWLFPTSKQVNEHLQFVTENARNTKGVFRA